MTIGERIKKRRVELGLTVEEIAAALDKNRATIYRYESNEIEKLPTTVIEPLADVLHTTPAYLMGWDDDPINYDDPDLVAELRTDILDHFNGDSKLAYKAQQAIYDDAAREQEQYVNSESSNRIAVLARHLQEIPENDREQLINTLESTIDIYLKAKGLK